MAYLILLSLIIFFFKLTFILIIDIFGFVLFFYTVCPAFSFFFLLFSPSLFSPFKKLFEICLFFSIPVFLSLVWKLHTFVSLSPPPQNCFAPVSFCDVMAWYFSSVTHFLSYQFSFIYPTSFYLN